MNIRKLVLLSYAAMIAMTGCLAACGDKDDAPAESAGMVKLSKTAYQAVDGSKVTAQWTAGEKCGLLAGGQNVAAEAVNTTEAALPFVFAVPKGATEASCIYTPYDETAVYADGCVQTDLTHQDGQLTQYAAALCDALGSKTTGAAPTVALRPLLAMARIHVPACSGVEERKLASVELSANGGEPIGGTVNAPVADDGVATATESKIRVELAEPQPLDKGVDVYVAMAPATLAKGYAVTATDDKGLSNTVSYDKAATFARGTITPVAGKLSYTELAFIGSNNVYIVNADNSECDNLDVLWHWDSSKSDIPTTHVNMFIHCDDAKLVDGGTKLLITSSATTGGCALIDRATEKCLFYARANNAHSAEWLPGGRIVVACSSGTADRHNSLLVFDMNEPDKVKFQAELPSAHGVQWIASRQRLYAIGEDKLVEYSLSDWNTDQPKLHVERTITTPKNGLHDLTVVSDDELLCAGNSAYLLHLDNLTFDELPQFRGESNVKSVNYNKSSGVIWATIAEESWWTFHIKEMHIGSNDPVKVLSVPFGKYATNVYKCRVYQW